MRKFITLDQSAIMDWKLNYTEAVLFSWFYALPSWAASITHGNQNYFFASYAKACEDLPVLTNKSDTMYRYYKKVQSAGLIKILILEGKVYVALTEKAKTWNTDRGLPKNNNSDNYPNPSDKHPSNLGQSSEEPRTIIRHIDSNTIDSKDSISPKSPFSKTESSPSAWGQGEFLNEEFMLSVKNHKSVIDNLPPKNSQINLDTLEKIFKSPLIIEMPKLGITLHIKPYSESWGEHEKQNALKYGYKFKELKVPLLENYLTYLKFYI